MITLLEDGVRSMRIEFVFPMSVCELVFFASCMGVYLTYFFEFGDYEVVLDVRRRRGRTESEMKKLTEGIKEATEVEGGEEEGARV